MGDGATGKGEEAEDEVSTSSSATPEPRCRYKYTPDPDRIDEFRARLVERAERGLYPLDRRDAYIRFLESGGGVFPDWVMSKPLGKARDDARARFRSQFRKQAGDEWIKRSST